MNDTVTHRGLDAGRQARVDLAAVYRLLAGHGWGDVIFTHAAMRVPPKSPAFPHQASRTAVHRGRRLQPRRGQHG